MGGAGCPAGMDAPDVLLKVQKLGGPCSAATTIFGHAHCNDKDGGGYCSSATGGSSCFLVGAAGMADGRSCKNHWGLIFLDSRGSSIRLVEFRLGDEFADLSGPLLKYLEMQGIEGCLQH